MVREIQRPKVGLGVILMREGNQVLLGKRKNAHGEGTWSFPGGHLKMNESLSDCAVREMKEETGMFHKADYSLIDITRPFAATNDIFEKEKKHYITLYLRANYIRGIPQVMEPDKCGEWRWCNWDDICDLNIFTPVFNLLTTGYNPFK